METHREKEKKNQRYNAYRITKTMPESATINWDYFNSLSKDEQKVFLRRLPSLFWIPNHAQKRAIKRWKVEPFPRVHIITNGNRAGKSEWLAEFLTGVTKGSKYVNPQFRTPFFDMLDSKREDRTLTIWWVCEADLMKKNGANYKIISKHIPDAKFKSRSGSTGVYREIHIPVKDGDGKPYMLVVAVKTHDQDTISFAGDNVDVILCDEPPPQKHWPEISGRMVTLQGEAGGRIIIGGTPLKIAAYILDIVEDAENETGARVCHDEGSIWENCAGDELPDEMALKYGIPKNQTTGIYETNGHLSREGIENAIKNWEKSGDPDEMIARVDGKFTHVQGRIYKIFNRNVHLIKPIEISANYPIIMLCDPHDTRPDCCGWYMITPRNKLICIAEYPRKPFENLVSRSETIPQTCDTWRTMESQILNSDGKSIAGQIVGRYGDPNYMNDPDPYTKRTKKQLYALHGFHFNVNITDNLAYGHEKVRQFLYYDRDKWEMNKEDPLYQPRLLFFNTCRNHAVFMRKYSMKQNKDPSQALSEQVDKKWKDFADLVRYAVVVFRGFEVIKPEGGNNNSEWEAIKKARNPYRNKMSGFEAPPTFRKRNLVKV